MNLSRHTKITFAILLAGFLLATSGESVSGKGLNAAWEKGVVTKAPWLESDGSRHIEVNDYTYTFVSPDVRVERHMRGPSDSWYVEPVTASDILVGQEVLIRVAAHHIYALIIQAY